MAKDTYGSLKFAGQQDEVSFNLEEAVEEGDAVTSTSTAGTLGRGSDGGELIGVVLRKEADNVGAVAMAGSNKVVTVPRSGAISLGRQALAVNGSGLVKAGSGTAEFIVIGTQTYDSVDYVTFIL